MTSAPGGGGGTRAFVGLGSNVGDRLENLRRAVALLSGFDDTVRVIRTSRVYQTEPVGGPPQPPYLNAVAEVSVRGSARSLLDACMSVEATMGRVREERWGPRVIDLDVLLFGDERIEEPDLVVPHPRMRERAFVMVPLSELDASIATDPRDARGVAVFAGALV